MLIRSREPFGTVAARLGYVSAPDIVRVLQEKYRRESQNQEPLLTGLMMVELGLLSSEQTANVLRTNTYRELSIPGDALRLAARLAASSDGEANVICCSGLAQHETRTVARQTAVALALMGRGSVLFVDARERVDQPKASRIGPLTEVFSDSAKVGFSEVLAGAATLEDAVIPTVVSGLLYLPPGGEISDYLALMLSERFDALGQSFRSGYRNIVIEAPPLLRSPYTPLIATKSDGVVLVVSAGQWRKPDVSQAKRVLDGLNVPLIGAVLYQAEG